nr:MAG TPA: hypothetical protein [Caudoviricetes sp.]
MRLCGLYAMLMILPTSQLLEIGSMKHFDI